jgi:hypothetical protein
MAITIRHLDGPLAGLEQEFDDSVEAIIVGRDPGQCHVVFPLEYLIVGRRHFELRRTPPGTYVLELFGDRYVEIDGMPAKNGARIRSGSCIRIGRPDGPLFSIEIDNVPARPETTSPQRSGASAPAEQRRVDSGSVGALLAIRAASAVEPIGLRGDLAGAEPALASAPTESRPPRVGGSPSTGLEWLDWLQAGQDSPEVRRPPGVGSGGAPPPTGPRRVGGGEIAPDYSRYERYPHDAAQAQSEANATFPMPPARRQSKAALWIALALGAAAAVGAYFAFRRDAALGASLGKLIHSMMPPPPNAPTKDLVEASVFGPPSVTAGRECLVQVLLHRLDQREIAQGLAKEADPDTTRRGSQTLAAEIARGQRVQIIVEGRGFAVDQNTQPLIWRGEPCACQFTVSAAAGAAGRTFHPRVLVLVDSVPVGSLTFTLKVTAEAASETAPEIRGDRARRYNYAFLSYASPDRAEVFKRAQGLKAGGTSFFNDLLSLDPGERWQNRLYQEIDRCDVFYLFWSSKAKDSEWVMKETEYALKRRAASANGDPDIIPVILEGPPPPSPPESLKDIHFNDSLLYVLAGLGSGPSVTGN